MSAKAYLRSGGRLLVLNCHIPDQQIKIKGIAPMKTQRLEHSPQHQVGNTAAERKTLERGWDCLWIKAQICCADRFPGVRSSVHILMNTALLSLGGNWPHHDLLSEGTHFSSFRRVSSSIWKPRPATHLWFILLSDLNTYRPNLALIINAAD